MGVTELGYARFGVSDLAAWRTFATDIIGLEVAEGSDDKRLFLRSDLWHHRIILEASGEDDLLAAGLRVAGASEFRALQAALDAAGIDYALADATLAQERRVLEMLQLKDPAGNPLEIFHGPQVDSHQPFHPGRGMYGRFCTGSGGVGHMMLATAALPDMLAFYELLGMRGGIEYRIPLPGGLLDILFVHCNERDHTFAFGLPCQAQINHIMLEVDNLDDVFLTYEKVKAAGIPIAIELGKHANDRMFSFYCVSPSGFQVEIGFGGRPATHQSEYYVRDTYGHQPVRGG